MKRKSRRPQRRRSRRRRNSRPWLIAGLIGLPVAVIGTGMVALNAHMSKPQINPDTYCYAQDNQYQSAFFIDYSFTDDTSQQQDRDLETSLGRAYDELPPNGQISVFTTARHTSHSLAKPVWVQCRPAATPAEQARIPAPEETPPYLRHQAEKSRQKFMNTVKQLMADAKDQSKVAHDSPLLEQAQAISRHYPDGTLKRLDWFSDGVQNTEFRQFCVVKGHLPPFRKFAKNRDYRYIKPNPFTDVNVNILLVEVGRYPAPGAPYCTNNELRTFWEDYFLANDASSAQVSPLRYGASG